MWPFWDSKGLVKKHQAQQESKKKQTRNLKRTFFSPLKIDAWKMSHEFPFGMPSFQVLLLLVSGSVSLILLGIGIFTSLLGCQKWRKTCDSVGFPTTRKVIWRIPAPWNIWLKDTTKIWEVGWASPFGASCIFTGDGMPGVKGSIQLPRKLKVFSWVSLCHPFCTRHHQCTLGASCLKKLWQKIRRCLDGIQFLSC